VLLLDSFMFAIGRTGDNPTRINEVIDDYFEVIASYLTPYMQDENF
jgi:hypothetical protein